MEDRLTANAALVIIVAVLALAAADASVDRPDPERIAQAKYHCDAVLGMNEWHWEWSEKPGHHGIHCVDDEGDQVVHIHNYSTDDLRDPTLGTR